MAADHVGAALRYYRERAGISTSAMAAHVGLSVSHWRALERGECPVTIQRLECAAKSLGIRPVTVLLRAESFASSTKEAAA